VEPTLEVLKYKEELAAKMGLPSPYGMSLMKELARDMVESGMVPKHFANNPMGVYMAALRGREMELEPMESVMETFWSAPGGNLGMYAKKMLQLMHRGGVLSKFLREDAEVCEILFTPPKPHEPYTAIFHAEEAKTAGLVKSDSNWMKWRIDMNRARAISRGYRALLGTFGKLSTFGGYSKEELEDSGMAGSTMGEPTEADRKRAEVLEAQTNGGMGDFKVAVKAKAAGPQPEPKPEPVIDVKREAKAEAKAEAKQEPQVRFLICLAMKNGAGEPQFIPVEGEQPQKDSDVARLRARALANDKRLTYVVMRVVDGVSPAEPEFICNPPEAPKPAASGAPVAQAATPAPTPSPAEPATQAAAPAPAVPIDKEKRKVMMDRLEALAPYLTDEHGKPIATKTAMTRFNTFFSGYFGVPVKELPKDPDLYPPVIDNLSGVLVQDVNEFRSGPEQCGKRCRERREQVQDFLLKQWPSHPETVALAHRLCCQWNLSAENFKGWFEANGLDFMSQSDDHALLRMALKTREACLLIKFSAKHNLSIAKICEQIERRGLEGTIEEASSEKVKAAVTGFMQAVLDEARRPAPQAEPEPEPVVRQEPPMEETPAEEEDGGGLFSDL